VAAAREVTALRAEDVPAASRGSRRAWPDSSADCSADMESGGNPCNTRLGGVVRRSSEMRSGHNHRAHHSNRAEKQQRPRYRLISAATTVAALIGKDWVRQGTVGEPPDRASQTKGDGTATTQSVAATVLMPSGPAASSPTLGSWRMRRRSQASSGLSGTQGFRASICSRRLMASTMLATRPTFSRIGVGFRRTTLPRWRTRCTVSVCTAVAVS